MAALLPTPGVSCAILGGPATLLCPGWDSPPWGTCDMRVWAHRVHPSALMPLWVLLMFCCHD